MMKLIIIIDGYARRARLRIEYIQRILEMGMNREKSNEFWQGNTENRKPTNRESENQKNEEEIRIVLDVSIIKYGHKTHGTFLIFTGKHVRLFHNVR